jgi:hypothetical protein
MASFSIKGRGTYMSFEDEDQPLMVLIVCVRLCGWTAPGSRPGFNSGQLWFLFNDIGLVAGPAINRRRPGDGMVRYMRWGLDIF